MVDSNRPEELLNHLLHIRRMSYALADAEGLVTDVQDAADFGALQDAVGQPLAVAIPELMGNEEEIDAILRGERSGLLIPLVNRDDHELDPNRALTEPRTRYFNVMVTPHHRPGGDGVGGLLIFVEDATEEGITQQRIMQQRNELSLLRDRLQAANRELQHLNELKSRFVAVAAHELRTPLTAIKGYVELLGDGSFGPLAAGQQRALEIIAASAERLLRIINNLLDISRIEAGRVQLTLRPVAGTPLIERAVDEFRPRFEQKKQAFHLHLPANLPNLLCDETRTQQILSNLLGNASKYTPAGGAVTLSAETARREGYLLITVEDTGIGIPLADQPYVFDTFFRASNVMQIDSVGAGLGLNITRSLAELQGGEIWCHSTPGEGATFAFTVPLAE